MKLALLALVAVLASSPAIAREYAEYSGPDAVQMGGGGTKINKDGIDFWTSGAPFGRYQVLGIITDKRTNKLLSGKAIGSGSIAKQALKAGGDAVIVLSQDSRFGGSNMIFNNGFATQKSFDRITTQLLVVKYLPKQ